MTSSIYVLKLNQEFFYKVRVLVSTMQILDFRLIYVFGYLAIR